MSIKNSTKKILITGSNGLLGSKLVRYLQQEKINFLATSKGENTNPNCPVNNYQELDITNQKQVNKVLGEFQPNVIINTAAMTNVDACESLPEECENINVKGFEYLFNWADSNQAKIIQISTDFIFDGAKGDYQENDTPNPLSEYGESKLKSEQICTNSSYDNWVILRTIVVYGTAPNLKRSNIVLWARESLKKKNTINIVGDQFRAFTWADDLAKACISCVNKDAKGVFHIAGKETMSIYDYVLRIADFYNLDKSLVQATTTEKLGQVAKRPPKTGFNLEKARRELNYNPISFEESLEKLENELGEYS